MLGDAENARPENAETHRNAVIFKSQIQRADTKGDNCCVCNTAE